MIESVKQQSTAQSLVAPKYINEKQVAEMLGISVRSLQGWRCRGRGPRFYRLGGDSVRYRADEVQAWAESQPGAAA
ncbi:MAG: helix-turn-helix domain-containing protein [Acidobacteria bacterium]|nr:helix-turn-helix domain-containing protein [Acidobacteriota bacterium]